MGNRNVLSTEGRVSRTPDQHLAVLRKMLEDHEYMANALFTRTGRFSLLHRERAEALRWILEETAYDVDPQEIVA